MQMVKTIFMNDPVQFKSLEIKIETANKKPVLNISGSLFATELLCNLKLEKASPQGINPRELLLEFCSDSKCPVTKFVYNPFEFSYDLDSQEDYQSVKLIYDGWISESFRIDR